MSKTTLHLLIKTEIIGDPQVCAIEFSVEVVKLETVYGTCRLWLEGKYIGDICEPDYLTGVALEIISTAYLFDNYTESKFEIPEIPRQPDEFINMLNDEESPCGLYISGETFDDFRKTYFRKGDKFIFYWCLDPDAAADVERFPQFKDFPKEVQRAEVEIVVYKETAEKFMKRIEEIIALNKNKAV